MMKLTSTSTHCQRLFVLAELKKQPCSTLYLRSKGVCSPAPRILELKKRGYNITKHTTTEADSAGVIHHNIAVYTLHPTAETGGLNA